MARCRTEFIFGNLIDKGENEEKSEIQEVAWRSILKLSYEYENESVLAVSHNFTILCLVTKVLNLPIRNYRKLVISLCGISRIIIDTSGNSKLVSLNETGHLF